MHSPLRFPLRFADRQSELKTIRRIATFPDLQSVDKGVIIIILRVYKQPQRTGIEHNDTSKRMVFALSVIDRTWSAFSSQKTVEKQMVFPLQFGDKITSQNHTSYKTVYRLKHRRNVHHKTIWTKSKTKNVIYCHFRESLNFGDHAQSLPVSEAEPDCIRSDDGPLYRRHRASSHCHRAAP